MPIIQLKFLIAQPAFIRSELYRPKPNLNRERIHLTIGLKLVATAKHSHIKPIPNPSWNVYLKIQKLDYLHFELETKGLVGREGCSTWSLLEHVWMPRNYTVHILVCNFRRYFSRSILDIHACLKCSHQLWLFSQFYLVFVKRKDYESFILIFSLDSSDLVQKTLG